MCVAILHDVKKVAIKAVRPASPIWTSTPSITPKVYTLTHSILIHKMLSNHQAHKHILYIIIATNPASSSASPFYLLFNIYFILFFLSAFCPIDVKGAVRTNSLLHSLLDTCSSSHMSIPFLCSYFSLVKGHRYTIL